MSTSYDPRQEFLKRRAELKTQVEAQQHATQKILSKPRPPKKKK